jgi:phage terminase small subunit
MNKLTIKQEKFALKYVECGNATESYRYAYNPKTSSKQGVTEQASRVLAYSNVSARIQELMAELKEKYNLTMHDLLMQLEEARTLAKEIEQPASMISATMGSAKLLGLDKPVPDDDEKGQKLDINFSVSSPVDDIKVTVGKPKE